MMELSASAGISAPSPSPQAPPPASPEAFSPQPEGALTPDEVQALRELIVISSRQKATQYTIPEKPPTQLDRERFADSIFTRKPYSEKAALIPGKLSVVFRCKTRREKEAVDRQIEADFNDKVIKTERTYAILLNNYNLMIQMMELNGVAVESPAKSLGVPGFSLRSAVEGHIINNLPEPFMFLISAALTQFESRVATMSREVLDKGFFEPAGLS